MNIEVKKSIEIDVVLGTLKDLKEEVENKNDVLFVKIERSNLIETLVDTIQVIEVLVKKNKQLRDINKNLSDKIAKRNESIEELTKMCKKLNDQVFELENKLYGCNSDTCNYCYGGSKEKESEEYQNYDGKPKKCKEKSESKDKQQEPKLQDVLD